MNDDTAVMLILLIMVLSAVTLIAIVLRGRQRLRELAIRERIAMIERGLVPAPEVDPGRFDRELLLASASRHAANPKGTRYRTIGVMLMGLGGALFLLLVFAAGEPDVAFGVAGGVFVLGIAAYANGVLVSSDAPPMPAVLPAAPPPSAPVAHPPDNVAR